MWRRMLNFLSLSIIVSMLAACTTITQKGAGDNVCANASCAQRAASSQSPSDRTPDQQEGDSSPKAASNVGFHEEETYNHLGTPVFSDPMGDAVTSGPSRIPFGTHVLVKCWAPNDSSMSSINAFYLIETSPWMGDYAPANTFLNGDTEGQLDPKVSKCPAT
jgi:hypothetical protein